MIKIHKPRLAALPVSARAHKVFVMNVLSIMTAHFLRTLAILLGSGGSKVVMAENGLLGFLHSIDYCWDFGARVV